MPEKDHNHKVQVGSITDICKQTTTAITDEKHHTAKPQLVQILTSANNQFLLKGLRKTLIAKIE